MTSLPDVILNEQEADTRQMFGLMALLLIPLLLSRFLRPNYLAEILTSTPYSTEIICVLVLFITIWSIWKMLREETHVSQVLGIAMAVMAVLSVFSFYQAPLASSRVNSILPYLFMMLAFAALVFLRANDRQVETVLIAAAVVLAISVLLDVFGFFNLGDFGGLAKGMKYSVARPAGLMASRNYAGELLAILLPLFMLKRRMWPLLLLVAIAIGFTRCRTAYLAAMLVCIVIVISAPYLKARWFAVGLVLLGLLLPFVVPNQLQWTDPEPYRSTWSRLADIEQGSGKLRFEQHTESWRVAREKDVVFSGFTMGMYYRAVGASRPDLAINPYPSSDFLRIWADTGVLGLGAFLSFLATALAGAVKRFSIQPQWCAGMLALIVCCSGDVPLFRPETIVAALMLMMSASSWSNSDSERRS